MSADDDTFDIDIYGEQEEQLPALKEYDDEELLYGEEDGYDGPYNGNAADASGKTAAEGDGQAENKPEQTHEQGEMPPAQPAAPSQGTKRKAESDAPDDELVRTAKRSSSHEGISATDSHPTDPGATSAIKFADLNWWTTEEDLRAFCVKAGVENELQDLAFGEHKINGKSRGEAYLEFNSAQAATAVKREVEAANKLAAQAAPGKRTIFGVHYAPLINPFRNNAQATSGNKPNVPMGGGARGGAYNQNYGHQRGNFGGRGGGGYGQNRGGYTGGTFNRMNQQQGGWAGGGGGMNGNMGGFGNGGYAGNPMMANMMAGFGNMGRGGMMNNMMGRGGYGMGNMGMMNPGGGMMGGMNNMMGRGGWVGGGGGGGGGGFGGNMQQGFGNQGYQGGGGMQQTQQTQANKRAKME